MSKLLHKKEKKPDLSLLDYTALCKAARVLEFGAKKYSRDNWKNAKGFEINRTYATAALRHIFNFINGEFIDEESRQEHIAHALVNCMMIIGQKNVEV